MATAEHCEGVNVVACCQRLKVSNCLESVFHVYCAQCPVLSGETVGCGTLEHIIPRSSRAPGQRGALVSLEPRAAVAVWAAPCPPPAAQQMECPLLHQGIGAVRRRGPAVICGREPELGFQRSPGPAQGAAVAIGQACCHPATSPAVGAVAGPRCAWTVAWGCGRCRGGCGCGTRPAFRTAQRVCCGPS